MAWRASTDQARIAAERRLAALSREWRPTPPPEPAGGWAVEEPSFQRRLMVQGWGRPALRGLAVLVVVLLVLTAYGLWLGRPRAVAEAPVTLATGPPLAAPSAPAAGATGAPARAATSAVATSDVVVHVVGAVRRPGIVRLPIGSRVADAVRAAGGVTRRRAEDSVNLARVLVDGEQVVVSEQGLPGAGGAVAAPALGSAAAIVDLNTATVDVLDGLPGIGPVIAARIVAWRTTNGSFRSVDELGEVSGIGDAILGQLRPLVRV